MIALKAEPDEPRSTSLKSVCNAVFQRHLSILNIFNQNQGLPAFHILFELSIGIAARLIGIAARLIGIAARFIGIAARFIGIAARFIGIAAQTPPKKNLIFNVLQVVFFL